jgi:hypothetical protein
LRAQYGSTWTTIFQRLLFQAVRATRFQQRSSSLRHSVVEVSATMPLSWRMTTRTGLALPDWYGCCESSVSRQQF